MARYRNDMDDERDYYAREDRLRRENFGGANDEQYRPHRQFDMERRPEYNRGRFGERANYESDEPRYAENRGERLRDSRRSSLYEGRDFSTARDRDRDYYGPERSRLRCRDIMTRDQNALGCRRDSRRTSARTAPQAGVGNGGHGI